MLEIILWVFGGVAIAYAAWIIFLILLPWFVDPFDGEDGR
ncbi:hypothetical protein GCM10017056_10990 [Seohaeicola zhoushanensis]|uniref:Uncharacterized protein n=1 Tax=Seohaeicola zhoushanensis TaxID=1569283 RepID=A0A8J3GVY3_9RHOB|nr:hypothetical protein GCM10017056_10990 [Seohaeicola zhoushanensis]